MRASSSSASASASASAALVVPKLPGWGSAHRLLLGRSDFRKPQLLQQLANGHVPAADTSAWTGVVSSPADDAAPTEEKKKIKSVESSKYRADPTQPAWIACDRLVLRFFGFFEDGGAVRRVVLLFYLSDRSLAISEPRVANSGLAQGEFLRRSAAVRKPSGERFGPEDFSVGGRVQLLGRSFQLVDCDAATREFYREALGSPQAEPRRYPDDDAASPADELEALRRRLAARAQAAAVASAESKAEAVRKFHAHSQQVLRFFVSWRDPHPLYPETRRYVLHMYLSDDTLEVVEPKPERDGRGHFAVLLSRRKMPKAGGASTAAARWLEPRDLRCGDVVELAARRFLLEDCDAFTRDYYLETHGVTQERFDGPAPPTERTRGKRQPRKWQLFRPHDLAPVTSGVLGGGSNNNNGDRTADHGGGHTPQAFLARESLDGKQLRFRARFQGLPPGDANASREFVLTFFLEDDTLAVFEPRVKNSGVTGGRFLDRGRFRKPPSDSKTKSKHEGDGADSFYRAGDLYVGAVVAFAFAPHQRLELLEADRQTLALCESMPERFPFSDAGAVLRLVTTRLLQRRPAPQLRRECRAMDAARTGSLSPEQLQRLLPRLGVAPGQLNAQQMITLCRRFELNDDRDDRESPPRFGYDDFCDAVASTLAAATPKTELLARLRRCASLRRVLREMAPASRLVAPEDVAAACAAFHVQLRDCDRAELLARFGSRALVDRDRLCDAVFELGPLGSEKTDLGHSERHSLRQSADNEEDEDRDEDSEEDLSSSLAGDDGEDAGGSVDLASEAGDDRRQGSPRVVALMQRVFGSRKYQLRRALRARDRDATGKLREDEFMAALLAVEPALSDGDTYLLADSFFPTNNSVVDYATLLEQAFRET
ncbi:hypothetical protein ATCC90586_002105 [Pythium insidiosum]|nr:hypothetical protein ATCC90586_002105 [Pythium insidiosum]